MDFGSGVADSDPDPDRVGQPAGRGLPGRHPHPHPGNAVLPPESASDGD